MTAAYAPEQRWRILNFSWMAFCATFFAWFAFAPLAPLILFTGVSNSVWAGIPLPLDLPGAAGCQILAAPQIIISGPAANGHGKFNLPTSLPSDPALVGLPIYLQWAAASAANPVGIVLSDALAFTI